MNTTEERDEVVKILKKNIRFLSSGDIDYSNLASEICRWKTDKIYSDTKPDLTNLWNEAVYKTERDDITFLETNDCWVL